MREIKIADIFDYTSHKLKDTILKAKRNPKSTQAEVFTLQAVLQLYLEGKIHISWMDGDPFMSIHEESGLTQESLRKEFDNIVNGVI